MKFELDRDDLKKSRKKISCSQTKFSDFKLKVQAIIWLIGNATFRENKGTHLESYNRILLP